MIILILFVLGVMSQINHDNQNITDSRYCFNIFDQNGLNTLDCNKFYIQLSFS